MPTGGGFIAAHVCETLVLTNGGKPVTEQVKLKINFNNFNISRYSTVHIFLRAKF